MGMFDAEKRATLVRDRNLFSAKVNVAVLPGKLEIEGLANPGGKGRAIGKAEAAGHIQRPHTGIVEHDLLPAIAVGLLDQDMERNRAVFEPAVRPVAIIDARGNRGRYDLPEIESAIGIALACVGLPRGRCEGR